MGEKLGASLGHLGGCDAVLKEHSGRGSGLQGQSRSQVLFGRFREKTQERELSLGPCSLGFPIKSPGSSPLHFPQNNPGVLGTARALPVPTVQDYPFKVLAPPLTPRR